jgi:hypothetical protein
MQKLLLLAASTILVLSSCASVPTGDPALDVKLKSFPPPPSNAASVYIFRDTAPLGYGAAAKRSVFIDNVKVGDTAPGYYIHRYVRPGQRAISVDSDYDANYVDLDVESGGVYFVEIYPRLTLTAAFGVKQVSEAEGKRGVLGANLTR